MKCFYALCRQSYTYALALPIAYGIVASVPMMAKASEIQFNTDVLDIEDRDNIDLEQFSRRGHLMPGDYEMAIQLNEHQLAAQQVVFYPLDDDPKSSEACITAEMLEQFGIKPALKSDLTWWHDGQCIAISSLPGTTVQGDLGKSTLYINLPQAYLEYSANDWDPPSRWDEGISGVLLDYSMNVQAWRQQKQETSGYTASGNGTVGVNLGPWRLRADWQAQGQFPNGKDTVSQTQFDWSRYYAYRALPRLGAKLTLGESYLTSDIFDSFRFAGASLISDDNMLPPNLRGYAPEVTGVARTNAKVTVSQQGRVLYETQVAAGPFSIQDLNDALSGQLDVRIEEQDGEVREFSMDTANVPYLTRPGTVRYKIAAGRPTNWQHQSNGPTFAASEFSWGVSNGWSLYGGGVAGGDYRALALGIGRDLLFLGALSFDVTQSRATLNHHDETFSGKSYRLSYSKRFDEYHSQVTFAGYRFSERDYMSMGEYLQLRDSDGRAHNSREMYTVTVNKHFVDLALSAYLNYSHQTYWDRPNDDRYNLTLSRSFDMGRFKNLSLSLTGYHNKSNSSNDDGMYLSLSVPLGSSATLSYNSAVSRDDYVNQVSYSDRINSTDYYQLSTGAAKSGAMASGYYRHNGDLAFISTNARYQEGSYSSAGLSLQGGVTATLEGAALHRSNTTGGTRILVDTDGVADIPVQGYGTTTHTNMFGKAVVADVSSYYRNSVSIDLNAMPENAEAVHSTAQATLTEGAIGYRRFSVVAGEKAMVNIRLENGLTPPFGSTVFNKKKQEVGIVNDNGSTYLTGINAGEEMTVTWGENAQCLLTLPKPLWNNEQSDIELTCYLVPNSSE